DIGADPRRQQHGQDEQLVERPRGVLQPDAGLLGECGPVPFDESAGDLPLGHAQLSRLSSASQNAGRSPGFREVMRLPSSTPSLSTQVAPAFFRSVRMEWYEVTVRPRSTSASASTQPAWQIAATGLPASCIALVSSTRLVSVRTLSGEYPPGMTKASNSSGRTSAEPVSVTIFVPFLPVSSLLAARPMTTGSCPASLHRWYGSMSSRSSTSSSTMKATRATSDLLLWLLRCLYLLSTW